MYVCAASSLQVALFYPLDHSPDITWHGSAIRFSPGSITKFRTVFFSFFVFKESFSFSYLPSAAPEKRKHGNASIPKNQEITFNLKVPSTLRVLFVVLNVAGNIMAR